MKSILLNHFESVYSLEAFLNTINLKLKKSHPSSDNDNDKQQQQQLKHVLAKLAHIMIAFDFKLTPDASPSATHRVKSIVLTGKYTYEQILYLCYLKVNEFKSIAFFDNHLMRDPVTRYGTAAAATTSGNSGVSRNVEAMLRLTPAELEKKLLLYENLAVSYFLSRGEHYDGPHWRALYELVGSSIMQYILIYAYVFRRLVASSSSSFVGYVQVSGCRFNRVYKSLVASRIERDEKSIREKSALVIKRPRPPQHANPAAQTRATLECIDNRMKETANVIANKKKKQENEEEEQESQMVTVVQLNTIFERRRSELSKQALEQHSVEQQLARLGHLCINRTSMLYDRRLNVKLPARFVYADVRVAADTAAAHRIIDS